MDLLVFLEKKSIRSEYIISHILNQQLGLAVQFTYDLEYFKKTDTSKFSYSFQPIENIIFFKATQLLFENDIQSQDIVVSSYKEKPIIFPSSNPQSILPFDPFAASFYMLTRYEEYLEYKQDNLCRFPATESLAYKNNFLHIPIVDYWTSFVKEVLVNKYPSLKIKNNDFSFINTIDVDNAFAYKGKGFFRLMGSFFKNFLHLNFIKNWYAIQVFFGQKNDPYNTYNELFKIHEKFNLNTIFFFLLGDYDKYDRNVNYRNKKLNKIIQKVFKTCKIGIHPSFASVKNPHKLNLELKRLEKIICSKVNLSRQHFIVLNIPYHYQNLINNHIYNDYSMGFPDAVGFRAGTSLPYSFFNLQTNKPTTLTIHPFSVMDLTLKKYMQLKPEQASVVIQNIISEIKKTNGCFTSIWHNESLSYVDEWRGWDNVYEDMIKYTFNE